MSAPRPELATYLEKSRPGARASALAGDASTRRFFRLELADGGTCVVMDYGEPFGGTTPDVELTGLFREAGLPVPEILEIAVDPGCLLLEDLGDRTLESAVRSGEGARGWIERAVELAARVASDGTPALDRSGRTDALDAERFRFEMDHFVAHYWEGLRGRVVSDGLRRSLHDLADRAATTPKRVLCHRDFHSRNLMIRADESLAMVDIQDARWGPDSYDLASLLRDAYIEIEEGWIEPLVDRYLAHLDEDPAPGFRERLDRVAAQRMIKALGTFGYQATVRREERYLEAVPRTLARIRALLPRIDAGAELVESFQAD
jgi:aminoglycoside/choline kinase family phosphotransferase